MSSTNENIDRLAQSFFLVLIFCSLISDSYIILENFMKNDYVKKKINYVKKLSKVVVGLSFSNYKKDDEGNIIIENDESKNNISDESDDEIEIEQISEELASLMKTYSENSEKTFSKIDPNEVVEAKDEEIIPDEKSIDISSNKNPFDEDDSSKSSHEQIIQEFTESNILTTPDEQLGEEHQINNNHIEIENININDVNIRKKEKTKVKKEIKETIIKKNNNKLNENILNKKTKGSKINQS
jgi:hypothetical protein